MVWMLPVPPLKSDTRAPLNSIANTAVSSANHLCAISAPSARQALHAWSRSVIGKALAERVANKHDKELFWEGMAGTTRLELATFCATSRSAHLTVSERTEPFGTRPNARPSAHG